MSSQNAEPDPEVGAEPPTLILESQGQYLAVGEYRIEAPLGAGGMAQVYRASHPRHEGPLALKVIQPGHAGDESFQQRFMREAQLASRVVSPHVVGIRDYGRASDGRLFLVMDLCPGETLSAQIKAQGPLAPEQVADCGAQVLRGLEAAHALGVIHRDIKSENLIVGPKGNVSIVDFGLAKQEGGDHESVLTATGVIVGTPSYMSPEQANGEACDARSDIYSLGIVLYEALSGERPFRGPPMQVLMRQIQDEPPSLERVAQGCPADLARVVHKALAKPPEERWQTALEFREALEDYLAGRTSAASNAPRPRRRVLLLVLLACLGFALAGGGLLLRGEVEPAPVVVGPAPTPSPSRAADPSPGAVAVSASASAGQSGSGSEGAESSEAVLRSLLEQRLGALRLDLERLEGERAGDFQAAYERLAEGSGSTPAPELTRRLEATLILGDALRAAVREQRRARQRSALRRRLEVWEARARRDALRPYLRLSGGAQAEAAREADQRFAAAEEGQAGALAEGRAALRRAEDAAAAARARRDRVQKRLRAELTAACAELEDAAGSWDQAQDSDFPALSEAGLGAALDEAIARLRAPASRRLEVGAVLDLREAARRLRGRVEEALGAHRERHALLLRLEGSARDALRGLPAAARASRQKQLEAARAAAAQDLGGGLRALQTLLREVEAEAADYARRERARLRRAADLAEVERCLEGVSRDFVRGSRGVSELPEGPREVLLPLLRRSRKRWLRFAAPRLVGADQAEAQVAELLILDRETGRQSRAGAYTARLERAGETWRLVALTRNP